MVDEFELTVKPKVPYKEMRIRKFKMVDRLKERLKQGMALREDNLWLSLFHTASTVVNTEQTASSGLSKDILAHGVAEIENNRLQAASIICNPAAVSGIRRWNRDQIDETARIEIREAGYLGRLWNSNFFITDLISINSSTKYTYAYILAGPQFLAWMPIRADGEIVPADRPDDNLFGFNGYSLMGMIVHNNKGAARVKFLSTGTTTTAQ